MKSRLFLAIVMLMVFIVPNLVLGQDTQDTGVAAEAIQQANLRAQPGVDFDIVGEIFVGIRYPVIGRSEFYPWLLLGERETLEPLGWVFQDLVTLYGNPLRVPVSTLDVNAQPTQPPPTFTPSATIPAENGVEIVVTAPAGQANAGGDSLAVTPWMTPTPSLTPTLDASVIGSVAGEVNLRYGPGVDYPIVGRSRAGDTFKITAYHTQYPWVQIEFADAPEGLAWMAIDLLEIVGNIYTLPAISDAVLNLPTLTPTPSFDTTGLSAGFAALGNQVWNLVLERGFVPGSTKFGALFVQDLQTGESFAFNTEVAFSGTSINKIPILLEFFEKLGGEPNLSEAASIANTMICSENVATNRLLSLAGGGDELAGADETTALLQRLGLNHTFITAPYDTTTQLATSTPSPRVPLIPNTGIDQTSANPDPTNQMTVDEVGTVLADVYQCAVNESGPLIDGFNGTLTPQECRKMLYVMQNNTVDALLKTGVPAGIPVAHKHGWIPDTHGNAAVMFTPGGDYVVVMMLFQPSWLDFQESLPLISEVSRIVYNYYNPDAPLAEIREGYIPTVDECNYAPDSQLVAELAASWFLLDEPLPTGSIQPEQ